MTRPDSPSLAATADARSTILLLSFASFFSGAALRICDSLLPRVGQDFGRTAGTAGLVIISFSVAYGLMQLLSGPLGDRYGKPRMVTIALFGSSVAALASSFAPSFGMLVGTRVLWGLAAAAVIPLSMAWVGDTVPYEQRQATLARLLTGTLSGMIAGQLAGGLFADSAPGWRGAFLTLCAGYALVAVLLALRLRGAPATADTAPPLRPTFLSQPHLVLGTPWARTVLLAVLAEGIFLLGPIAYLPAYLHQRFGLSLSAASALIAMYGLGGLAYALMARHLVRRLGERRMVLAGGVVMGAGFLGWLLSPVPLLAGPIALLVGFGTYLFHNTLQTHATQMVPAARGTAVSLFAFCLFTGQALGVSLGGYAFDHGAMVPLLLTPALALPLAAWAFARALRQRESTR